MIFSTEASVNITTLTLPLCTHAHSSADRVLYKDGLRTSSVTLLLEASPGLGRLDARAKNLSPNALMTGGQTRRKKEEEKEEEVQVQVHPAGHDPLQSKSAIRMVNKDARYLERAEPA